ncbi:MAG TPA: hypothetical protein VL857_07760 [Candidatus Eisenbacteria bacterium]|jgi:hypothetical protein|nr:hypothetical protein [Candidatus Eisenbacteria bacterium]
MSLADRILRLDRRIIFILVALGTALPLLVPVNLPITVTPRVEAAYDTIDQLPAGSTVLFSLDYEPDVSAELQPMTVAIMRHCFRKNFKVVALTLYPAGPGLVEPAIRIAAEAEHKVRNKDYAFLGYKSGFQTVMIGMGESIRSQFPVDFYGTPLDSIPVMRGIRNYGEIALLVNLTASSAADYWIQFAVGRYRKPMVLGATAVMATDYYPYLSSKQLLGLIGGMKGAAEYEKRMDLFGDARRGMDAQSLVHVIVTLLVILGNVALFASRRGAGTR